MDQKVEEVGVSPNSEPTAVMVAAGADVLADARREYCLEDATDYSFTGPDRQREGLFEHLARQVYTAMIAAI